MTRATIRHAEVGGVYANDTWGEVGCLAYLVSPDDVISGQPLMQKMVRLVFPRL